MLDSHVHDNNEHDEAGGGFIIGLLAGALLGVGLGMLLAPKAGADLRDELGEQARSFGAKASERYQRASETATGLTGRGREFVNQAREAVNRGAEEARDDTAGGVDSTGAPGSFDDGSASDRGDTFRS